MKQDGLILKSNGGMYEVELENEVITCRPRGIFRHEKTRLLVGDRVTVSGEEESEGRAIDAIYPRTSLLQRPPMANLSVLFIVVAAAKPAPIFQTIDRLLCVVENSGVQPVLIITKCDLSERMAMEMARTYEGCGYDVIVTSSLQDGEEKLASHRARMQALIGNGIGAFAGASGVGKTSLMRALFPELSLAVGELSKKTDRGKQTTRMVQLFPLRTLMEDGRGYLADTPGFSVIDYVTQSNLTKENLALAFREFQPHLGDCRYTDCTHLKEQGCAILDAVSRGEISKSRHESYLEMYAELKQKNPWDDPKMSAVTK